jgi:hypothetical protein
MNTPKEVFTFIRDEKGVLEKYPYFCNAIKNLFHENKISFVLMQGCFYNLEINKPKNDSFTSHRYWYGYNIWWNVGRSRFENKYNELLTEKRRFLTYLIEKL